MTKPRSTAAKPAPRSRASRSGTKPTPPPEAASAPAPIGPVRRYRIRGAVEGAARTPTAPELVTVTSSRRIVPGAARAAGDEIEVADDEVVRVELDKGFVLWVRTDDLLREHGRKTLGRDGADAWEIALKPPIRAGARSSRGWLDLGIKALEFFGIDLKKVVARDIGAVLENRQLGNEPGRLYRCSLADEFSLSPLKPGAEIEADKPWLVFLHGTASSCQGSFGKLWQGDQDKGKGAEARRTLAKTYGERVFAFEHKTLTESPIQNALQLLRCLPAHKGMELHLVSHSRGGLVGELLCLGGCDHGDDLLADDLMDKLFVADRTIARQLDLPPLTNDDETRRKQAYDGDRAALRELLTELRKRQIKVSRFVRVACPARGTTLASGRLDRWLSVLTHLMGDGVVGDVADFMLAVVKQRTDPRTLPGLEAMMPGSALTRLLQHPKLVTSADLSVIAGDSEGDGILGYLRQLITDWFYGSDHDLVVNTGSMTGGLPRPQGGARFLCDKGTDVSHFRYFGNEKSIRWLVTGLTRADGSDGGFKPIAEAPHDAPRSREALRRSRAAKEPRPLAVVLPGTMGSALAVKGEDIWLRYLKLALGGLGDIRMGTAGVEPTDLLDDFYGPLLEYLADSHRIEIFPYDWRLSVRDAAARLTEKLEGWLPEMERIKQPVHIVAHSMGGLVTRAMIADGSRGKEVWQRICALPNSRFMMLGTPNLGSYEAVRWLTGFNATLTKLSLLDITQSTNEIIDLVREFPGLLELLPFDGDSPDFTNLDWWRRHRAAMKAEWPLPDQETLRKAGATWDLLRKAPLDPKFMIYVAGCQPATVIKCELTNYDSPYLTDRQRLEFFGTRKGDGTVSWQSGILNDVPVWYVENTAHDALCAQRRALPAYLDLLTTGTTTRLSNTPPVGTRAAPTEPEMFVMPALPPVDDIPGERRLRGLGLGPGAPDAELSDEAPVPAIEVRVVHGDLAYARYPVMVGHYHGDVIVNAEAKLDARLGHTLSQRLQLDLYPGKAGTHAHFFNDKADAKPKGAVVIGLGLVGELSPRALQSTVCAALLDYALEVAHWPDERFGAAGTVRSAGVSSLLIGSGQGGTGVRESVESILRGAVQANERLQQAGLTNRVLVDQIEFLDIYQDAALSAAKALTVLLADGKLAGTVSWKARTVEEGPGHWSRVQYADAPGWWQRLEIVQEKGDGGLRFISSTDRARAEVTHATGQLRLAEGFIRQASRSPATNTEVAKTLFEMLLPNRLKELAPQQGNIVIMVDAVSARYPWELIEDRWSQNGEPPAVAAGMIRQLKTATFRPAPMHATEPTAFVVGNPDLDWSDKFPDLPGAREEAQKVATLLSGKGFRVNDCIDEKADALMAGLHRDAWRILHLAGHGEHEYEIKETDDDGKEKVVAKVSGMVIGKETFLTPGDIEQMRYVPELVFINCCHLGKTQAEGHGEHSLLAANLGLRFIEMGVKAVVAAGWAVDDAAAGAFAESFYQHMFLGDTFGEAIRAAREEIWQRFRGVNTWGAYQCYGDPAYRFHGNGNSHYQRQEFQSPAELVAELDNRRESLRVEIQEHGDDPDKIDWARQAIRDCVAAVPEEQRETWTARGDVAAAIGFAWGETGDFDQGIEWLDRALKSETGDCPIRTVEQCANFHARRSAQRWQELRTRKGGVPEEERLQLVGEIENAIRELAILNQRAPTAERLNLLGSACKCLAWVQTDEAERLEALVNMASYYRQGFELKKEEDPYPFANWAVATVLNARLARTPGKAWRAEVDRGCRRMAEKAKQQNEARPNFWSAVGEGDCKLAQMMASASAPTAEAADAVAALYRAAAERGASLREYASVVEHLDFVVELSADMALPAAAALKSIRAKL